MIDVGWIERKYEQVFVEAEVVEEVQGRRWRKVKQSSFM